MKAQPTYTINICDRAGRLDRDWYVELKGIAKSGEPYRIRFTKSINCYKTAAARRKAAQRVVDQQQIRIKAGWSPQPKKRIKAGDFSDLESIWPAWIEKVRATQAESTYLNYRSRSRIYLKWVTDKKHQRTFAQPQVVEQFFADHLASKSNSSWNVYRQILSSLFSYAGVSLDVFEVIPAKARQSISQPVAFNEKALPRVMGEFKKDPSLYLVINLIYSCFIRPKEIRLLRVKDVDLFNGVIEVPAGVSKNKKAQKVVMPDDLVKLMLEYGVDKMEPSQLLFYSMRPWYVYNGERYGNTTEVLKRFPGAKKSEITREYPRAGEKPVGKNLFRRAFCTAKRRTILQENHKLYGFKHTGAIQLVRSNVNIRFIQNQLRHHSLDQVEEYIKQLMHFDSKEIRGMKLVGE